MIAAYVIDSPCSDYQNNKQSTFAAINNKFAANVIGHLAGGREQLWVPAQLHVGPKAVELAAAAAAALRGPNPQMRGAS